MIHRTLSTLLLALLAVAPVRACNVPVFRYALEHWRARSSDDLYRVTLFHRGPLTPYQRQLAGVLKNLADAEPRLANLEVEPHDVAAPIADRDVAELWRDQHEPPLPWIVVQYPNDSDVLWSGPLGPMSVRRLVDSPARREMADAIMSGYSVVWVMIESGDQKIDDAAALRVRRELTRLESVIKLPEEDGGEIVPLMSALPLVIRFHLLRVAHNDPYESTFVSMLLRDPALRNAKGPIFCPVFGRGRCLDAIPDEELTADAISGASRFLCGACSCRAKRLAPGVDLLVAADWEAIFEERTPTTISLTLPEPERVDLSPRRRLTMEESEPEMVPIPKGQPKNESIDGSAGRGEWYESPSAFLGGAVILLLGLRLWRSLR